MERLSAFWGIDRNGFDAIMFLRPGPELLFIIHFDPTVEAPVFLNNIGSVDFPGVYFTKPKSYDDYLLRIYHQDPITAVISSLCVVDYSRPVVHFPCFNHKFRDCILVLPNRTTEAGHWPPVILITTDNFNRFQAFSHDISHKPLKIGHIPSKFSDDINLKQRWLVHEMYVTSENYITDPIAFKEFFGFVPQPRQPIASYFDFFNESTQVFPGFSSPELADTVISLSTVTTASAQWKIAVGALAKTHQRCVVLIRLTSKNKEASNSKSRTVAFSDGSLSTEAVYPDAQVIVIRERTDLYTKRLNPEAIVRSLAVSNSKVVDVFSADADNCKFEIVATAVTNEADDDVNDDPMATRKPREVNYRVQTMVLSNPDPKAPPEFPRAICGIPMIPRDIFKLHLVHTENFEGVQPQKESLTADEAVSLLYGIQVFVASRQGSAAGESQLLLRVPWIDDNNPMLLTLVDHPPLESGQLFRRNEPLFTVSIQSRDATESPMLLLPSMESFDNKVHNIQHYALKAVLAGRDGIEANESSTKDAPAPYQIEIGQFSRAADHTADGIVHAENEAKIAAHFGKSTEQWKGAIDTLPPLLVIPNASQLKKNYPIAVSTSEFVFVECPGWQDIKRDTAGVLWAPPDGELVLYFPPQLHDTARSTKVIWMEESGTRQRLCSWRSPSDDILRISFQRHIHDELKVIAYAFPVGFGDFADTDSEMSQGVDAMRLSPELRHYFGDSPNREADSDVGSEYSYDTSYYEDFKKEHQDDDYDDGDSVDSTERVVYDPYDAANMNAASRPLEDMQAFFASNLRNQDFVVVPDPRPREDGYNNCVVIFVQDGRPSAVSHGIDGTPLVAKTMHGGWKLVFGQRCERDYYVVCAAPPQKRAILHHDIDE